MTPEISEFSYGFALTNEIVGWATIKAAPLFPSLLEEGKAGGGYDVKLDMPGIALYLQFKRADCMKRRSAQEIKDHGLKIAVPFYRFKITESGKSDQHELLLALDDGASLVFYAAPRFHEFDEINEAWINNWVATRSIFVAPQQIGPLDSESHHVAYDGSNAWLCSAPRQISFLRSDNLAGTIIASLHEDRRSLRDKLPELLQKLRNAEEHARARLNERFEDKFRPVAISTRVPRREAPPLIPGPPPRPLLEPERQLREISDIAARTFNSQIIIAQPAD